MLSRQITHEAIERANLWLRDASDEDLRNFCFDRLVTEYEELLHKGADYDASEG